MKKTFFKNLYRNIKKTISRFLSIVIIIAIGVSFYAGVRATSPDMKKSADTYFSEKNFMDFKIISTLGLTKDDLSTLKKINGVTSAQGAYSIDAVVEENKSSLVLNINSLPKEADINKITITKGRKPQNSNEAVVEERFLSDNKLKIGDKIKLKSGTSNNILDSLKNDEFIIVGAAISPIYASSQRQLSSVGNGSVKGFVYILPEVFKYDCFTEIYIKAASDISNNSLSDSEGYKNISDNLQLALKKFGKQRCEIRYTDILKNANAKITEAETNLNNSKSEAETKFAAAKNAANLNNAELLSEQAAAERSFKAAEEEIQKNRNSLKNLQKPEWYILGRSENIGYESYKQDSDRIDNIGKAFPLIFFFVAALVSLTTMTRMVQENRTEIGTFKALGYSRAAIVAHYLIYSLAASLAGSILGISIGFKLFPPLIMNAYNSLYAIPDKITPFNYHLSLEASLIAIIFTTFAAVAATLEELREVPATLMRPKPPKSGKAIFLEKATFLWKRLSFTRKVTARNIFRYKQRFFMTVIGIAACTGLMITGYGIKAGVTGATENQFNKIYKYNMQSTLTKNIDSASKKAMNNEAMKDSNIKNILFYFSKNCTVKNSSAGNEDFYLVVPEQENLLNNYIYLTMKGKKLDLTDDGVIITEKLSRLLKKKIGDTIEITADSKTYNVKISAITEHYVQHYIYMSPSYYEKLTGQKLEYNSFYGILKNTESVKEDATGRFLTQLNGINSVSFKNNLQFDYLKSMDSMNSVIFILIASAGVLAFVVIYNLTNINISERNRELATIKLLGFYNNELAMYIYRENIILTIIGSLFGVILGIVMNNLIINTVETDFMMFSRTISPIYFLYSILLTLVFSILVNLIMYKRFDNIDMIEALKNAE